jgi:hypothetical protein
MSDDCDPDATAAPLAAEAELAGACAGWRSHQRCVDENNRQLRDPHPACLAAQHRYVVFLIDHGLIDRHQQVV